MTNPTRGKQLYYRGKVVEELTKEELLEALYQAYWTVEHQRETINELFELGCNSIKKLAEK